MYCQLCSDLLLVIGAHALGRRFQRVRADRRAVRRAPAAVRPATARVRPAFARQAVETPRVLEHRRIAARLDVGEDGGDRLVDRGVLRTLERQQRVESGVEIGVGTEQALDGDHDFDHAGKGVEDRRNRFALELERRLIDDQARRNVDDVLDRDQVVGLQRAAGGHQIDDGVGQPDQRRQFHRAVELDQVDVHALGGEVLARDLDVLGGHLEARALAHGVR